MKMATQKIKWNVRKSQSARGVVVVESKSHRVSSSGNGVRIRFCSDAKIQVLRGEYK